MGQLGSVAWWVSARFQNISQLVGRLGSVVRVSVSFQKKISHLVSLLVSGPRMYRESVRVSFQFFSRGEVISGGISPGGYHMDSK